MFHRWVGALVGLALIGIAGTASAQTTRVTMTFVAAGFTDVFGETEAPQDPVSGTFTYDTDSTTGEIVNLVSVSLTISGHAYSLGEVGFRAASEVDEVIAGVENGLFSIAGGTNDFFFEWSRSQLDPGRFKYASESAAGIWSTFTFTSFSLTEEEPEPIDDQDFTGRNFGDTDLTNKEKERSTDQQSTLFNLKDLQRKADFGGKALLAYSCAFPGSKCGCIVGSVLAVSIPALAEAARFPGEARWVTLMRNSSIALLGAVASPVIVAACTATGDPVGGLSAVGVAGLALAGVGLGAEYMADEVQAITIDDPPDPNFTEPFVVTYEEIAADFGLGASDNARVNTVLNDLFESIALSRTALGSIERYQGALIEGDEVKALARYQEFLSANESIDNSLRNLGDSIHDLKRVCGANCSILPDPQILTDLQASIVSDGGLVEEVKTILVGVGLTLAEIEAVEQKILALSVDDIPNVSLNDVIDHYARVLAGPRAMPWLNLLLLDD